MKKLIAVLLAALMCVSVLLACGGSSDSGTKKEAESTATTTESKKEEDTTASAKEEDTTASAKEEDTTASEKEEDTTASESEKADDDGYNWPSYDYSKGRPDETYDAVFILYVPNDGWPRTEQVQEYIRELTKKDLNISCTVKPFTFSSYTAQIPLMLAANEQIDVLSVSNPSLQYEQGYILDLLDYEEYITDAIDWIGRDEVMASLNQGHLFTLPWQLERTHRYGMAMRTDILKEIGYEELEDKSANIDDALDYASEIFDKVREKYPDITIMGGPYNSPLPTNNQHTDGLTDGYGVLDNYGAELKVINRFETEDFKKTVTAMKKWFDAGYVQKDIATSKDSYESLVKAGNTFGGCCPMKPDSYAEKRDQCNHDMTIFYFREDMMLAYTGNPGYTISGTSKDPVQAARLLNYVFTSREFEDAINWGVPGVDWVESPDDSNVAMYPEGVSVENAGWHNSYGWAYPNERIAHVWIGNDPKMYTEIYPAAEKDSHRTKAWGFIFDNTEWHDTIGAIDNIRDEYLYKISSGDVADVDAEIKKFNDKMYASNLQGLMDAKQEQLDKWAEEKGIN